MSTNAVVRPEELTDPPIARFVFANTRMAWFWLIVRLYVGWEWLQAGWHKVNGNGWMDGGSALHGYWARAVEVPENGNPAITYGWYRELLQYMLDNEWYTWFGKVVAVGELLIGLGLIVGLFTGIAAFFGALLNMSFMLAGSASTNPVLFFLAIGLILAWKIAGYYGLDSIVLARLGTPWSPVRISKTDHTEPEASLTTPQPSQ